jgi:hypothetical protein
MAMPQSFAPLDYNVVSILAARFNSSARVNAAVFLKGFDNGCVKIELSRPTVCPSAARRHSTHDLSTTMTLCFCLA